MPRQELAVLQEAVQRIELHEAPLLTARYLATLGEREYRLLQLQVDVRAYRRRIELAQARRNHGQSLNQRAVAAIVEAVNAELEQWRVTLRQRQQDLALAQFTLSTLRYVPDDQVQAAKLAYRQLARWLHPDAHPENAALFARFWPAVQAAYQSYDLDQLETLVQVISRELPDPPDVADDGALTGRLQQLVAKQARLLADLQAHPKPKAFSASCSACWRGYVAGWCIKRGRLYLEKLDPFGYGWPDTESIEFTFDVASGLSVPTMPNYLTKVFPDTVAPVFADWFSGELRYLPLKFYTGKLVSRWEAEQAASVIEVERGRILVGKDS